MSTNVYSASHAATLDPKKNKDALTLNQQTNSSASLKSYAVPSLDGKLLPAIPKNLALKFKPPTVAVVYLMKDNKSGRMKKYIHEIRIHFDKETEPIDVSRMCDDICRKEATYLNPAYIGKQQVSIFDFLMKYQVLDLLNKLYKNYAKNKENSQPNKKDAQGDAAAPAEGKRKKNFFERKRFVDYPMPEDENQAEDKKAADKPKEAQNQPKEPVKVDDIVSSNYPLTLLQDLQFEKKEAQVKEVSAAPPKVEENYEDDGWGDLEFEKKDAVKAKESKPEVKKAEPEAPVHIDFFGTDKAQEPAKQEGRENKLEDIEKVSGDGLFGNEFDDLDKEFNQFND